MRKIRIVILLAVSMVWFSTGVLAEEPKPQESQEIWQEIKEKWNKLEFKPEKLDPKRIELLEKQREEIKAYLRHLFARYYRYQKKSSDLDQELEKIKTLKDFMASKEGLLDEKVMEALDSLLKEDPKVSKDKEDKLINLLGDYLFLKQIIRSYPAEVRRKETFQRLTEGSKKQIENGAKGVLSSRFVVGGYLKKEEKEKKEKEKKEKKEPSKKQAVVVVRPRISAPQKMRRLYYPPRLSRPRVIEKRPFRSLPRREKRLLLCPYFAPFFGGEIKKPK